MRAVLGLVALALVACGGSAQSSADGLAGAAAAQGGAEAGGAAQPDSGGSTTAGAGGLEPDGAAGAIGVSEGGEAGADRTPPQAGAGGAAAAQGGSSGAAQAGAATSGGQAGGGGAPMGGSGGAVQIAGSGGTPSGGNSGSGSAGSAGSADPGVGTVVVTWTVGGVAYDGGANPAACGACFDQYGNSSSHGCADSLVLSYGPPGQPRDSGAFAACGEVNLTKKLVPATALSFKIYLDRAYTQYQTYTSPNYAMDPAVVFTATVVAGQTTNIAVDFPSTGADGATFSITN